MAKVTIPHIFVNLTNADADQVNACFAAIAALVNGNIGDDNIPNAAIAEAKVIFGDTGHAHGGGTDGKPLTLDEADITFEPGLETSHDHDGDDGGALAALAVANGNQGTLIPKSGILENVADEDSDEVVFGEAFPNAIIAVDVYHYNDETGTMTNLGLGMKSYDAGDAVGYYLSGVSVAGFTVHNELGDDYDPADFKWTAIGC